MDLRAFIEITVEIGNVTTAQIFSIVITFTFKGLENSIDFF